MPNFASVEAPVRYRIVHTTKYQYGDLVSVSHHVTRLTPRPTSHQQCEEHAIAIEPPPNASTQHTDYFGNTVRFFAMQGPHRALVVTARSTVTVTPATPPASSAAWETATVHDALPLDVLDYVFDSPTIRVDRDLAAYARPSFSPGRPLLEAVRDLTQRIFDAFTFDPRATTIATPLSEVFSLRRGVCQDFARLQIACLRSIGVAARYVSGYLETLPPPGAPRRVGADASHAWVSFYSPEDGWIDVDPTNNLFPSASHVTLGWGRDYVDVSPIRGVILGGGEHSLDVSVDVSRVDDTAR